MDAADEQRLLAILRAAQNDPAALSLVPLDLTFADRSENERARLRTALLAAAVPHWFDARILAALLDTTAEDAATLMAALKRLSNVEPFPARGQGAFNVHEASRTPLRAHLRQTQPDLWQTYAQRACDHFTAGDDAHVRIEHLYHRFAADSAAAVESCVPLVQEVRGKPGAYSALILALAELESEHWLSGPARVEAQRAILRYRHSREEHPVSEEECLSLLDLSRQHSTSARVGYALHLLSDVRVKLGHLSEALGAADESLKIAKDLAASAPANAEWQRDLAASLTKLGDLEVAQGDLARALHSFSEAKAIAERLAARAPANAKWQRDLSVSHIKLGNLAVAQGDLVGASRYFTESKTIFERLTASDPANASWQRDLSVSLNKLGELAAAQGDLTGALRCFTDSKAIRERLAASDPTNAAWQRDLSVSIGMLGTIAIQQGNLTSASQRFIECTTIFEHLAASDPANAKWQRDLSVSLTKLGELAVAQGELARALLSFSEAKNIAERLAASDSANAEWQRDLSVALGKLGELAVAQGDLTGALHAFSEAKNIAERLAASDPANAEWQRDLFYSCYVIAAKVLQPQQRWAEALQLMEQSLRISARLAATDRSNVTWQKDERVSRQLVEQLRAKVAGK